MVVSKLWWVIALKSNLKNLGELTEIQDSYKNILLLHVLSGDKYHNN